MSKKDSVQKRLQKVRAPRVQLTYDVEKGDAIEEKELPFVMGVMSDLSGANAGDLPPVEERPQRPARLTLPTLPPERTPARRRQARAQQQQRRAPPPRRRARRRLATALPPRKRARKKRREALLLRRRALLPHRVALTERSPLRLVWIRWCPTLLACCPGRLRTT